MVLVVRFLNDSVENSLINNPFRIQTTNGNFQRYKNSPWEFRDQNDTLIQVWRSENTSWEFRDPNDTSGQVQGSKNAFWEFSGLDDTSRQVWRPPTYFTL